MPDSRRVLNIEKEMGFKWKRGLSRTKGESCKVQIVKNLIDDIDVLKQEWVDTLPSELRTEELFQYDCVELFEKHAKNLYPPLPADRSTWLVSAAVNDWDGLYPVDLSITEHYLLLKDLFVNLIFEKCVRFHDNQRQKGRRAFNLSLNPESPENASPEAGPELRYSTGLTAPNKLDNATACSQKEPSLAAPVAQMIPRQEETSHHGSPCAHATQKQPRIKSSSAIKSDIHLSDSSSEDSDSSMEGYNELRKKIRQCGNGTTIRVKRIRSNSSQSNSPAKKQKTHNVKVKDKDSSLQTRRGHEPTNSRVKLKLKNNELQRSPQTEVALPQAMNRSGIGSAIRDIHKTSAVADKNSSKPKQKDDHLRPVFPGGHNTSSASSENKDSRHSSGMANYHRLSDTRSASLRDIDLGDNGRSIYDIVASPVLSERTVSGTQHSELARPDSLLQRPDVSFSNRSTAYSQETSQPTSSLFNEYCKTPSSRDTSIPPVDDGKVQPIQEKQSSALHGDENGTHIDENSTRDLDTTPSNTNQAYVEDAPESMISLTPLGSVTSQKATSKRPEPGNLPEAFQSGRNEEIRASTMVTVDNDTQLGSQVPSETVSPAKEPKKDNVASTPSFVDETYDTVPQQGQASTDISLDNKEEPSDRSLAIELEAVPTNSVEKVPTSQVQNQATGSSSQQASSRKLFIQLNTTEANKKQFVIVTFDCGIDDFLEKVQQRMNKRLSHHVINCLNLRLPSQPTDEDPYLIDQDDPDTWEVFLEMAKEEEGDKIRIAADVEL